MDKAGRKAKRESFTQSIRTRVTDEQKELIEFWAEKDDRTVSQFLRISAMKYINVLKSQEAMPELLEFMKKASMDLGDVEHPQPPRGRSDG